MAASGMASALESLLRRRRYASQIELVQFGAGDAGAAVASDLLFGSAPGGVTGASAATIALSGAAAGALEVAGASAQVLGLVASSAGSVQVAGVSAGTLQLAGAAGGAVTVAGQSAGTINLAGTASGTAGSDGSIVGQSAGQFAITTLSSGVVLVLGQSAGQLVLVGVASGVVGVTLSPPLRTAYPPVLLRVAEPGAQPDAPEPDTTAVIGPIAPVTVSRSAQIGALDRTLTVPAADYTATT